MHLRILRALSCFAALAAFGLGAARADVVANFEDLSLATNSANPGPLLGSPGDPPPPGYTVVDGTYGPVAQGAFTTGGVSLINQRDQTYGSWGGFAYSNQVDTASEGWTNQFSTYAGAAHSGTNFGVAFGYHDLEAVPALGVEAFDPLKIGHLEGLPYLSLPEDAVIRGMYVANTTYTALTLIQGDGFTPPMGVGDWYRLSAYGTDASGNILTDASGNALAVDLDLARWNAGESRFVANQWLYMDLSALADAQRLYFNVSGSIDVGYGLATPAYFAVDDITYTLGAAAVPEPASLAMAGSAVLVVGLAARRRVRA